MQTKLNTFEWSTKIDDSNFHFPSKYFDLKNGPKLMEASLTLKWWIDAKWVYCFMENTLMLFFWRWSMIWSSFWQLACIFDLRWEGISCKKYTRHNSPTGIKCLNNELSCYAHKNITCRHVSLYLSQDLSL